MDDFQRARSPEQREARRRTILGAAADLLAEMPLSEISLRELARRVGLSKTNVVRYFETREAVFFALLNQELDDWISSLEKESGGLGGTGGGREGAGGLERAGRGLEEEGEVLENGSKVLENEGGLRMDGGPAVVLARSLATRPLICELWSSLGSELERNISTEAARDFKVVHAGLQRRLADIVAERVEGLTDAAALEFVHMAILLVAGLWPFANPAPSVAEALQDARLAPSRVDFPERLGRALHVTLSGLLALH